MTILDEVSDPARRVVLHGGLAGALGGLMSPLLNGCAARPEPPTPSGPVRNPSAVIGFASVPPSRTDEVVVPDGYLAQPIAAWGEPVGIKDQLPPFKDNAGNSAAEQAVQMGMHHDGLQYFALGPGSAASLHGLLVTNHEYTDDGLLHEGGMNPWTAEKVRKSQAAHGVSVIELMQIQGQWQIVRPSRYARRITAPPPIRMAATCWAR
jgi:secreted PhoX family phosphatase